MALGIPALTGNYKESKSPDLLNLTHKCFTDLFMLNIYLLYLKNI